MTPDNANTAKHTEIVKGIYADFSKGNVPAIVGRLNPQVQWTEPQGLTRFGGSIKGAKAVQQTVFTELVSQFGSLNVKPETFVAQGNRVSVLGTYSGTSKTGSAFKARFTHMWTLDGGEVASMESVADTALMNPALGR